LAMRLAREAAGDLQLYPDPDASALKECLSDFYGLDQSEIMIGNGSDEILNMAFQAFCSPEDGVCFPDITYGFYPVIAKLNGLPAKTVPLREDYTVAPEDYENISETVVLANPNAPTGIALSPEDIRKMLEQNPGRLLIVDEAYVDFGAVSVLPLIRDYDNLLVVQTFSKSRSLAGGRLGLAAGNPLLIADLETVRNSTNPYNVNRMTMAAAIGALLDRDYFAENCRIIAENREKLVAALSSLGFSCLPSKANFVLAARPGTDGETVYRKLKEKGVLVRYWNRPRLRDYVRISVGSVSEIDELISALSSLSEVSS
ncbi:MAG: histidinol-phosphate transaminase, partial [Clostridia bacterium]|nr:histidinol-phosphate transaminase [Clostridia bacterium]